MIQLIFILEWTFQGIRADKGGDSEEWMYWFRVILLSKVRAFKVWLLVTFYAAHEHDEDKNALMHISFIRVHGRLWQNRRKQVFLFNFFCCSHHSSQTFLTLTNPAGIKEHNSLRRGYKNINTINHYQLIRQKACYSHTVAETLIGDSAIITIIAIVATNLRSCSFKDGKQQYSQSVSIFKVTSFFARASLQSVCDWLRWSWHWHRVCVVNGRLTVIKW